MTCGLQKSIDVVEEVLSISQVLYFLDFHSQEMFLRRWRRSSRQPVSCCWALRQTAPRIDGYVSVCAQVLSIAAADNEEWCLQLWSSSSWAHLRTWTNLTKTDRLQSRHLGKALLYTTPSSHWQTHKLLAHAIRKRSKTFETHKKKMLGSLNYCLAECWRIHIQIVLENHILWTIMYYHWHQLPQKWDFCHVM